MQPFEHGLQRLLGMKAVSRLREAKIAIVGLGGVGSWAAESLARSGVGHLVLMDLDEICATNINRQIMALNSTVGQSKIEVVSDRCKDINSSIDISMISDFFGESSCEGFFASKPDLVIDCIDSHTAKCLLISECKKRDMPLVVVGSGGGKTDPSQIKVEDLNRTTNDFLLFKVRKNLKQNFGFPRYEKKKFHIPTIFSDQLPLYPDGNGEVTEQKPGESNGGLDCSSALGSISYVTGMMGMMASWKAIELYLSR